MAESVVDIFEVIDVQKNQGDDRTSALRSLEFLLESLQKRPAIGQAGERIIICELPHLFLTGFFGGDIAESRNANRLGLMG